MTRSGKWLVPAVALAAVALAGCNNQPIVGNASVTTVPSPSSATVDVRTVKGFGQVLVTSQGRSLYMFTADPKNGTTCAGSCLLVWPPLLEGGSRIKAGPGVNPKLLSVVGVQGGGKQVCYNGYALYTFEEDAAAGMASGEGTQTYGGTWYLMSPSGHPVKGPTHG